MLASRAYVGSEALPVSIGFRSAAEDGRQTDAVGKMPAPGPSVMGGNSWTKRSLSPDYTCTKDINLTKERVSSKHAVSHSQRLEREKLAVTRSADREKYQSDVRSTQNNSETVSAVPCTCGRHSDEMCVKVALLRKRNNNERIVSLTN